MYYGADIRMRPGPHTGVLMIGTWVCTKSITILRFEIKREKRKKNRYFFTHFISDAQLLKGARNAQVCFHVKYNEVISVAGF